MCPFSSEANGLIIHVMCFVRHNNSSTSNLHFYCNERLRDFIGNSRRVLAFLWKCHVFTAAEHQQLSWTVVKFRFRLNTFGWKMTSGAMIIDYKCCTWSDDDRWCDREFLLIEETFCYCCRCCLQDISVG